MSYRGYLIKIGTYIISEDKYIAAKSFQAYANPMDKNSYRDLDGILHRKVLKHVPVKAEFTTPDWMPEQQFEELMSNIQRNYIDDIEQKVYATVFVPEYHEYISQEMYMVPVKPIVYTTNTGSVFYGPVRIAFVGY